MVEGEARAAKPRGDERATKPKAAASLTAEVVARGRQRTQAYGEAGLWRGNAAPPAAVEAPVRVVLPPLRKSEAERDARSEEPPPARVEPRPAHAAAPPEAHAAEDATPEAPKDMGDLAFYLIGAALVSTAALLVGLLFF